MCVHIHLDGVGFSRGGPEYHGLSSACQCCVCMKGRDCGVYGTQYVSAEPFPLSRGLLPRNPDGEGTDNVRVARIRVEVPTFCAKNTNQWVYFTPGCVSHRRVPLEWITDFLTFLKSCEIHHSNKKDQDEAQNAREK